jgi:hypothetical protein
MAAWTRRRVIARRGDRVRGDTPKCAANSRPLPRSSMTPVKKKAYLAIAWDIGHEGGSWRAARIGFGCDNCESGTNE